MKLLRVALIVPTLLLSTVAFAEEAGKGATRDVPDFDGVQVAGGLNAKVTVGPKSVRISGDEKQVSQVVTEVVDGKLVVKMEKKGWFNSHSGKGITVTVSSPKVTSLEASGGADIDAEASAAESFAAEASGGAEIHAQELSLKVLSVDASGGCSVEANPTERIAADLSGGSTIHVDSAPTQREVSSSGGARVVFSKK